MANRRLAPVEVSAAPIAPQEPTTIDLASWSPGRQAPRVRLTSRWIVDMFDGRPRCIWFVEPLESDYTAWPFAADWPIRPALAARFWDVPNDAWETTGEAGVAARQARFPRLLAIRLLVAGSAAASLLVLAVQHASPQSGIIPAARLAAGVGGGP